MSAAQAQSVQDQFYADANAPVRVIVVQPDGKILVGGDFTTIAGIARNRIARLNHDGSLDAAFDPDANAAVETIALQADGKVHVGGSFTTIGGQTRNRIARLDPVTGLPDSFNPNANNTVFAIGIQTDGKVLVGGQFTSIGGQTRNRIARLDGAGLADSFDPNASTIVFAIAIQTDGKILAGGAFQLIGGQSRNRIARLDPASGLADSLDPNANGTVSAIALQADGKIVVGGGFTSVGGQGRSFIARLDATTGMADSFNPSANSNVWSLAVQPDGRILAGGFFTSIGGQLRRHMARLDGITGLADSFDPNFGPSGLPPVIYAIAVQQDGKILAGGNFTSIIPNGAPSGLGLNRLARLETDGYIDRNLNTLMSGSNVYAIAIQPDGKILIGGEFSSVQGIPRNNIARLNTDGTVDLSFNPNASSAVYSIVVQPDGSILVGGFFFTIGGQTRNYLARLNSSGAADSFNPNPNSLVTSIAVQTNGRIVVCGLFTTISGQTRNRIARIDPASGAVDSFNPNANGTINSIAIQPDGKIIATGQFTTIGGQTRNRVARLNSAVGDADSFDPNSNGFVFCVALQPDGKVIVGGDFTSIGGAARNSIARLDATTGLADAFDPNSNGRIFALAVQTDGKILVGGEFNGANSIGGQTRNRIARLEPTTGLADTFNPDANNSVYGIAIQNDGKYVVGGNFNLIGGQSRNYISRLLNDSPSLQNLAVSQTAITWTRSGAGMQFRRVTFESSTDNVNFTTLGDGTLSGSSWTLTGLSFPTSQNLYIRARGTYRDGSYNGSESTIEYVRNAYLPGPTPTATNTSTPTATATLTPTNTPTNTPTPGTGCGWQLSVPYPNEVYDAATVTVGTDLYVFGGRHSASFFSTARRFDGTQWFSIASLPQSRAAAAAVTDGTNIFIIGGDNGAGAPQSTLYRYNIATDTYTTLASLPISPAAELGAVYLNGKIYRIGGRIGGSSATSLLEAYDIALNTWSSPLPGYPTATGIRALSAFVHNGFIYTAGGINPSGIAQVKAFRFDPVANTWDDAAMADLPQSRYSSARAFVNGGAVMAGGVINGTTVAPSVISWDPGTNVWSSLNNMVTERFQISGAVLNGSFYVIGGQQIPSPNGTTTNQQYVCTGGTPTATFTPTITATATATNTPTFTPTPSTDNIVFVTSTSQDGNLGGLSGADSICQTRANSAGLPGTYRAILSSSTVSASARLTQSANPYRLVNGTIIANNWADLTDGALAAPINRTESNGLIGFPIKVWTASNIALNFSGPACSNWTSSSGSANGVTGDLTSNGFTWINEALTPCDEPSYLYCVQQVTGPTATATATPTATATSTTTSTPTASPSATPIVLLDTISSQPLLSVPAGTPRAFVGNAWTNNSLPGGTAAVQVTSVTMFVASLTNQSYNNVVAKIRFWNNYNAANPSVFSNAVGSVITHNMGPQSFAENTAYPIEITFATPITLVGALGTNWGFAHNIQGDTGSGPVDTPNLTPVVANGGTFAVGQITNGNAPSYGYYRANSRTDYNFDGSDFETLPGGEVSQAIGIIIRGYPLSSVPGSVSGTVTYGNPASPTTKFISNAAVTGSGSPNVFTTTAAPGGTAGQYTLTGFGSGSYTVSLAKTTGQNGIASADAARIAQHVSGISLITAPRQLIAADVTNNGAISSTDAAQIARFVSALGPPIGLTNQWRFFVPNPTFPIGVSPTTRSYTDPIGVQTGQDYIGILVGEVTGNWNPTAAREVSSKQLAESSGPERGISVELPNVVSATEKEIVVPVKVENIADKNVISYEFDLRYDPSVMQPLIEAVDVEGTISRGLSVVTNPTEPGLLRVVVYGAYPIDVNGTLLNLRFTSVGSLGSVSPMSFERIMFNEGVPVKVINGEVRTEN